MEHILWYMYLLIYHKNKLKSIIHVGTLPETDIAPENKPSQKETSLPNQPFSDAVLVSGRVNISCIDPMGKPISQFHSVPSKWMFAESSWTGLGSTNSSLGVSFSERMSILPG